MLQGRRIVFPVIWVNLFIKIVIKYADIPKKSGPPSFLLGDHFLFIYSCSGLRK